MRNRYPGICTHCGARVDIGTGHFERRDHEWVIRCVPCVRAKRSDYRNLGRAEAAADPVRGEGDGT